VVKSLPGSRDALSTLRNYFIAHPQNQNIEGVGSNLTNLTKL